MEQINHILYLSDQLIILCKFCFLFLQNSSLGSYLIELSILEQISQ